MRQLLELRVGTVAGGWNHDNLEVFSCISPLLKQCKEDEFLVWATFSIYRKNFPSTVTDFPSLLCDFPLAMAFQHHYVVVRSSSPAL